MILGYANGASADALKSIGKPREMPCGASTQSSPLVAATLGIHCATQNLSSLLNIVDKGSERSRKVQLNVQNIEVEQDNIGQTA